MAVDDIPKAPPISAPLVGMFTFTIPQSEPNGLVRSTGEKGRRRRRRMMIKKSGHAVTIG
jgi:hypothetical protein